MNPLARRLFFTNKAVIGKDLFGNPIEVEGCFQLALGASPAFVVIGFGPC